MDRSPFVAFGVRGSTVPKDPEWRVGAFVPLTARLSANLEFTDLNVVRPLTALNWAAHLKLQDELEAWWGEFAVRLENRGAAFHRHDFDLVASNTLLLRWVVRSVLRSQPDLLILLPSSCRSETFTASSISEFVDVLPYLVLRDESKTDVDC